MILILALLLAQESADEVIKALSQESAVARGEAADKLVARGRKSIPVLRQAIERAATVRDEAQKAVDRIGSAEVAALLKERGHAELNDLRRATHAALTAALPHATVDLLPANAACGACKNVERVAVLNDLTDEKGGPRIIAKPSFPPRRTKRPFGRPPPPCSTCFARCIRRHTRPSSFRPRKKPTWTRRSSRSRRKTVRRSRPACRSTTRSAACISPSTRKAGS